MTRMSFVGDKNEVHESHLPATAQYPSINVAEFQGIYHFLSNESEMGILHYLTIARVTVNSELNELVTQHGTLDVVSTHWFGEPQTGTTLYKQAVLSLAAHAIVGNKLSTDATAEAADRQEALQQKADNCLVQYRQAVDLLLYGKATYTFEVV
ncbi:head completion/stabilization protein [Shewanella sp. D64]|uniref:head completion/stabilization protein n=1 Tax=unclassified Shewanella TaxID=196818 RepID=UPI0022BA5B92|nr:MULTISPECIES: head completion/stabilization protein [unclassified Shewanella]MEC4729003.1 head completion/stabilization protein [Shewanella sp. D64]MEC4740029.1 head completion/stabilization protein [Shewanella sp. E94]WBJ94385.1 head completion/stabilization protein [Shewanella sp. MTB7]